ncbi:hypothetical protein AURANDRAFT_60436 [Aureococcus anophagefferens]|uniref:Sulfotransferase domain-containing protein n=1 Tax=Aureococcus anophagefferens TaxID=44056 RepID=F0XX49_AURAN|nr:hypothetical protein AURANDRAFT_60436 [Aureococcus anophagefferens]EGB13202.1 hypothetical protein AURANDRAFT_60436 [Aureococcus anophagefferens]|eukprot:XP_009032793.1 hypothetical protein AURANDRAFT_60436 [Aureococcus anophagefferens]
MGFHSHRLLGFALFVGLVVGARAAHTNASSRPILAMHVMKAGGTALCKSACQQFNGKHTNYNCRLDAPIALDYLKALDGHEPTLNGKKRVWKCPSVVGPNVTAERTSQAMTANKALCNTIMIEPGWRFDDCAKTVLDAVVARPAHSSMWTSYTWLLLVRDPLERFVSYAAMGLGAHRLNSAELKDVLREESQPGESYYILTELVGVRTVDRKHNARPKGGPLSVAPVRGEWAYAKARGYDLSLEDRRLLRLANVCDLHVVDKANRMITELAAAYGYQPPRVNHA